MGDLLDALLDLRDRQRRARQHEVEPVQRQQQTRGTGQYHRVIDELGRGGERVRQGLDLRSTHKVAIPMIVFHIVAMLDWVHLFNVGGFPVTLAYPLIFRIVMEFLGYQEVPIPMIRDQPAAYMQFRDPRVALVRRAHQRADPTLPAIQLAWRRA